MVKYRNNSSFLIASSYMFQIVRGAQTKNPIGYRILGFGFSIASGFALRLVGFGFSYMQKIYVHSILWMNSIDL